MGHTNLYIGIDLAATAAKTAICVLGEDQTGKLKVVQPPSAPGQTGRNGRDPLDVDHLTEVVVGVVKENGGADVFVAIDAPFGWPSQFADGVGKHKATDPFPFAVNRDEYRYRATDRFVREKLGLIPLSPSTDRLGVVALVSAALVHKLLASGAGFDVAVRSPDKVRAHGARRLIIEVYPEATATAWFGLRTFKGYKKDGAILESLAQAITSRLDRQGISLSPSLSFANDHQVDASIAAVTAFEFAKGRCLCPTELAPTFATVANREGWIWFPRAQAEGA